MTPYVGMNEKTRYLVLIFKMFVRYFTMMTDELRKLDVQNVRSVCIFLHFSTRSQLFLITDLFCIHPNFSAIFAYEMINILITHVCLICTVKTIQ